MFAKLSKKSFVKNILVISLTNIGDIVMTSQVVDVLHRDFPHAKISMIIGPKGVSLFDGHPFITAIAFDKHANWNAQRLWLSQLRKQPFDAIVDLRNTILPFLLKAKYRTGLDLSRGFQGHLKDKHLWRLKSIYDYADLPIVPSAIAPIAEDIDLFDRLVKPFVDGKPFVLIAPTAADSAKRWTPEGFAQVADQLANRFSIVVSGDAGDVPLVDKIQSLMKNPLLSLAGKVNLRQLAYVLSQSSLAITHDSGAMHLASYFNVPIVALFGPTNPAASRPWSDKGQVVWRNKNCPRCLDPRSSLLHNCMSFITPADVLNAVAKL